MGLGRLLRAATAMAVVWAVVAAPSAAGSESRSFNPGYAMSKQYVAVTAYKILRDHAPSTVEGCEPNVKDEPDRFDDLSTAGAFTRGAINCLDKLGYLQGLPGGSGSSFEPGYAMSKQYVAVTVYKILRDHAPGAVEGCEPNVKDEPDRFDDLSAARAFTRGTINCLDRLGYLQGLPGGTQHADGGARPSTYKAVTAVGSRSCAIATDDTLTCWGLNYPGYGRGHAPSGKYKAVAIGQFHSCAIATDDTITCWGENSRGQTDTPDGKYKAVTADSFYTCVITADDTITCWGRNNYGRAYAPDGKFRAVSSRGGTSCAIAIDETITCWGSNNYGRTPDGKFRAVSTGGGHSCAIAIDDTITCWGSNNYGQTDAPNGTHKAVSAGGNHSCAIAADDTITCWGRNYYGQTDAPDGKHKAVSVGGNHSCAIAADDTITCWGWNYFGQINAPNGT